MTNNEKATLNLMQLLEGFVAFNFQLINFLLFEQEVIPA